MLNHVAVTARNLDTSRKFYDAVLGKLGYSKGACREDGSYLYIGDEGLFSVTRPLASEAAVAGHGGAIGFTCQSRQEVDLWHTAGIAQGGRSLECPPRVRRTPEGRLYLAYMHDPDGNELCALYRMPS